MEKIILVFGDSTAWGAWDLEKGGWVNRLWLHLANTNPEIDVYNLSISGGTTETILERLENEARVRKPDVILIQTGGNDSAFLDKDGNYWVSPEKFESNLEKLVEISRKFTDKVIFVGFKNIDDSKTQPVPWDTRVNYKNDNVILYNGIMKKVAEKLNIGFIDLFGLMVNNDLPDGVHPDATGHKKIFEKVREYLKANKII